MNIDIWVVGTSNQVFIRGSTTETKFPKKKVVIGKTLFFVIGPFCTLHSSVLTLALDKAILLEMLHFQLSTFN